MIEIILFQKTVCSRCGANIYEREFDYDLNSFDIYNQLDEYVASVYPSDIAEMKKCRKALKEGECPLCDNWEDGLGHTLGHGTDYLCKCDN